MTTEIVKKTVVRRTHRQFTEDSTFRKWCAEAGVEPTRRQASKFRRGIGQAARAAKKGRR